jgi:hypothetical protein
MKKLFGCGLVLVTLTTCTAAGAGSDQGNLWQGFVVAILNDVFSLPVAVVVLGVLFRKPLSKFIRSIRRIKLQGVELITDLATIKGELKLKEAAKKKECDLDDEYPEAAVAIITAYAKVDTALREKYAAITGSQQCQIPAIDILSYLWEKRKITTNTLIVADSMCSLREHIFSPDVFPDASKISKEQLEAYKRNADTIVSTIRSIKP